MRLISAIAAAAIFNMRCRHGLGLGVGACALTASAMACSMAASAHGVLSGGTTFLLTANGWSWPVLLGLAITVKTLAFTKLLPDVGRTGVFAMLIANAATTVIGVVMEIGAFFGFLGLGLVLGILWWTTWHWWPGKQVADHNRRVLWLVGTAALFLVTTFLSYNVSNTLTLNLGERLVYAYSALALQLYVTCGWEMHIVSQRLKRPKTEVRPAVWRANAITWAMLMTLVTAVLVVHRHWPNIGSFRLFGG